MKNIRIAALAVVVGSIACRAIRAQDVEWQAGGNAIRGTLHMPKDKGPFPAVVYVPGSGRLDRGDAMAREIVKALVAQGIAVLTYDKRGVGNSTGSWRDETLADYATDVLGGIAHLEKNPSIDRAKIGLIAHSQGGWVGPLAAQRSASVGFLVLLSATPLSPLEQSVYAAASPLRARNLDSLSMERATSLIRTGYRVYQTDSGWAAARATIASAASQPWYDPRMFGLQPDTAWNVRWLRGLPFDFDVRPTLLALTMPILTVNGAADAIVPAEQSRLEFQSISSAGNRNITSVTVPGLRHGLGRDERGGPDTAVWQIVVPWIHLRTK